MDAAAPLGAPLGARLDKYNKYYGAIIKYNLQSRHAAHVMLIIF